MVYVYYLWFDHVSHHRLVSNPIPGHDIAPCVGIHKEILNEVLKICVAKAQWVQ